ncbi:DUF6313 family protein [Streptomyces sp. MMS24-I2-30]|uniref:DUF6313 family protein n=1 Tax=Streptomyces sp. MMS24-I2-30 TaxID=3351564 RepID=UPI003896B734
MSQPAPPPPAPPPRDTWRERCRDWRRSVSRLNRPQHWLLTRFLKWGTCVVALYGVGGLLLGWTVSYDVLVGITSPADTPFPVYAWFLSLTGWLVVPAVVGGATGYLVNREIDKRRRVPEDDLLEQMTAQGSVPPSPRAGDSG